MVSEDGGSTFVAACDKFVYIEDLVPGRGQERARR
jgi:hypothetical protein